MTRLLPALLIAALATPGFAGGPVVIEEAEEVVADAATSANLIVPLLLVLAIGLAVASGDGDDDRCSTAISKC
jgi:hypothetical protein